MFGNRRGQSLIQLGGRARCRPILSFDAGLAVEPARLRKLVEIGLVHGLRFLTVGSEDGPRQRRRPRGAGQRFRPRRFSRTRRGRWGRGSERDGLRAPGTNRQRADAALREVQRPSTFRAIGKVGRQGILDIGSWNSRGRAPPNNAKTILLKLQTFNLDAEFLLPRSISAARRSACRATLRRWLGGWTWPALGVDCRSPLSVGLLLPDVKPSVPSRAGTRETRVASGPHRLRVFSRPDQN